jgi:hypothetical protein
VGSPAQVNHKIVDSDAPDSATTRQVVLMVSDMEMNEADLEARIVNAIKVAFPFLKPNSVRHQLRFSVRLGRSTSTAMPQKHRVDATYCC